MDTKTASIIYALEFVLLYALVSRTVRTVWFRQVVLTVLPLCIAFIVVQWHQIPLWIPIGGDWGVPPNPPDDQRFPFQTKETRLYASVLYYLLMGLASGIAFRKTKSMFGFPLLVFFATLALHFYHLVSFQGTDVPTMACNEDEWVMIGIAVCSVWTLREFSHLSMIAALAMVPATSLSVFLVYQASEVAKLHENLFEAVNLSDLIRKANDYIPKAND